MERDDKFNMPNLTLRGKERIALPTHRELDITPNGDEVRARRERGRRQWRWLLIALSILSSSLLLTNLYSTHLHPGAHTRKLSSSFTANTLARCRSLTLKPGPPLDFDTRTTSDRFVNGTKPVLIRNAKIWTGGDSGREILKGDILLDGGIIKQVGKVEIATMDSLNKDFVSIDAHGAWVTPGIVDLHSHMGVDPTLSLSGTRDGNSHYGPILPWLRSLDGLNTHDDAYKLSISGGITTALVLPGSANAIGGQGFVIKLRDTAERSPTSKLLEPPYILNGTDYQFEGPPRWRQMKHACGENPSRVYSYTRMDNLWAFRQAYNHARLIRDAQDAYCSSALSGDWASIVDTPFPEDLQWEALVDALRGKVKVHVHCYETVDLDDIVRLTNEFKFPIAAFHHAHETYLVPDVLKKAYGNIPTSAIFATNTRYKRESYRGSEFAPRILADHDLPVVMKSDHPVLNSRYLLYEAQQAHYYGLPPNLALAAVTTTPAKTMGMDHRIGFLKQGYDADIVIWDSHPLTLGATPKQVYIDGIPQLTSPHTITKPHHLQHVPKTPNFDEEAKEAVKHDGLPPLGPKKSTAEFVVFENVGSVYGRVRVEEGKADEIIKLFDARPSFDNTNVKPDLGIAITESGKLLCVGTSQTCNLKSLNLSYGSTDFPQPTYVDLQGGSLQPGLLSYGSALGLEHIQGEISTKDGYVFEPILADVPELVGAKSVKAVDGLEFGSRDALLAYQSGTTSAVVAPLSSGFTSGLSTAFTLSASHKLSKGAILQEIAAMHVHIGPARTGVPSVSTQIAVLRSLLEEGKSAWGDVAKGVIPLVVSAQSVDVIASLISLKKEFDALALARSSKSLRLTIATASEAHILAQELGDADVGVILVPSRPYPKTWESRRILPGPPLTEESQITQLLKHNVTVGIGIQGYWSARSTRFDVGWAALESSGTISRSQAIALASSNLEYLLGLELEAEEADIVATRGGELMEFESKVVGIASPRKGVVDLF